MKQSGVERKQSAKCVERFVLMNLHADGMLMNETRR